MLNSIYIPWSGCWHPSPAGGDQRDRLDLPRVTVLEERTPALHIQQQIDRDDLQPAQHTPIQQKKGGPLHTTHSINRKKRWRPICTSRRTRVLFFFFSMHYCQVILVPSHPLTQKSNQTASIKHGWALSRLDGW